MKIISILWIIALIFSLLGSGCGIIKQTGPDAMLPATPPPLSSSPPVEGDILLSDGSPAELESFLLRARRSDFVLLGEGHSSPCDHRVQAALLQAMEEADINPALGLEMVAVDKQDVLDKFNDGELSPAELEEALEWPRRWGHSFELYLPVFELAEARGIPLFALNIPNAIIHKVSAEGLEQLSKEQRSLLPEEIIPPRDDQKELLEEEFERHLSMFQDGELTKEKIQERLERFFLVQSLWDTAMAQEAVRVRRMTGRPLAVLAGSGHVEYGWGMAHRLSTLDPHSTTLLVVPWRGRGEVDPAAGDIFYFCPLAERAKLGLLLEWGDNGALVLDVAPDSKAEAGGVLAGDVILKAMEMQLEGLFTLHQAGRQAASKGVPLQLTVQRGNEILNLDIALPNGKGNE